MSRVDVTVRDQLAVRELTVRSASAGTSSLCSGPISAATGSYPAAAADASRRAISAWPAEAAKADASAGACTLPQPGSVPVVYLECIRRKHVNIRHQAEAHVLPSPRFLASMPAFSALGTDWENTLARPGSLETRHNTSIIH